MDVEVTIGADVDDETTLVLSTAVPRVAHGGIFLPFGGVSEPDVDYRYTYAPASIVVPGLLLTSAILDAANLPLQVEVWGTSEADLAARRNLLEAALGQWSYTVTLTVGSTLRSTWRADPSRPRWGEVTYAREAAYALRAAVVIPVHPL